ncbi:hypothetical protein [Virgibacillus phasianinus]|nr:hypothetical protein [Virgibacillus phasianinus]
MMGSTKGTEGDIVKPIEAALDVTEKTDGDKPMRFNLWSGKW